ncbi:MAG: dihydroorotase, partial [Betaproteobacteria bacterium]|nr:dihydroorotase [Betaproteobacteria bacterium]
RHTKENDCGCAGVYTAHAGIELYAEAFDAAGALARLEGFASVHGPAFYGLPRNDGAITLRRQAWDVPVEFPYGEHRLVGLRAGGRIGWALS